MIKKLFILILWLAPFSLVFLLLFSIYPNYILAGHHNKLFNQVRRVSDRLISKITPEGKNFNTSILINSVNIASTVDRRLPPTVNHPLIQLRQPESLPESAYFQKPKKPVVALPTMIPNPFTTFAPLPGKIAGLVSHNQAQFRYPMDLEKKKWNEVRIFLTGGSTAWGYSATDVNFTIAGFMEKELREKYPKLDVKVITAAAGAWTSTQERIWIFNRITEYEPDMIVSYSGFNDLNLAYFQSLDLYDMYYETGMYFRYAIQGYEYYNRGEAVSALGIKDNGARFKPSDFPRKTLKNVQIINAYLKAINIPYVYVLQPVYGDKPVELYSRLGREMALQAQQNGFLFIDHSELFKRSQELFLDVVHFGDRGYQAIANDLIAKINLDPIIRRAEKSSP